LDWVADISAGIVLALYTCKIFIFVKNYDINLTFSMPAAEMDSDFIVGWGLFYFFGYTIVDIIKSKFQDETTKVIWLLVVILLGLLGSILYWIFGRQEEYCGKQLVEWSKQKNPMFKASGF
jgi:hypothetical protein